MNGKTLGYIGQLRQNKVGKYPFLSIIAACADPNQRKIHTISDYGIDYVIVKRFGPIQLVQRFERIAKVRKPFSVTSSYIGPDRRDFLNPRLMKKNRF